MGRIQRPLRDSSGAADGRLERRANELRDQTGVVGLQMIVCARNSRDPQAPPRPWSDAFHT